jgi:Rrf2 family nitric oxide-sensitive transcriptional repressor
MRLTMFTDFALRTLILAASKRERNVTIEEAAAFYGISAPHLKKVVRTLTRAGFLEAHRGRSGGFRLARAPEEINLGGVIRATEPDFALVECFRDDNRCLITRSCRLPLILNRALEAMLEVFDRYSLADIVIDPSMFGAMIPAAHEQKQPKRGPRITSGRASGSGSAGS